MVKNDWTTFAPSQVEREFNCEGVVAEMKNGAILHGRRITPTMTTGFSLCLPTEKPAEFICHPIPDETIKELENSLQILIPVSERLSTMWGARAELWPV